MTASAGVATKPKPVKPMTPEEQLESLEQEALAQGMQPGEFQQIQSMGDCPVQIQWRIGELREWIAGRKE